MSKPLSEPLSHEQTLLTLNRISEMIADRTPLSVIFYRLAEAAQLLAQARWGLFLYLPVSRPAEFYGPDDAVPLGPFMLKALENTTPTDHTVTSLLIPSPIPSANSLSALATLVFQGRTLRGALAAFYQDAPTPMPVSVLTLLSNQARIAMEKWRLGNIGTESLEGVIHALASLIDTRDPYALRHSHAVTELAVTLAEALDLDEEEITNIRYAAVLHDIGKIGISEAILSKPGPLLPGERAVVEAHPLVGVSILRNIPSMENIVPLIRHHHEHYDGGGYPERLAGDQIPLGAQIIAVADVFEALTTGERSYHRGLSIAEACGILRSEAGKSLNPKLVAVFLQAIGQPVEELAGYV
jgi:putative nucleotidyltransferase with HDIG domain